MFLQGNKNFLINMRKSKCLKVINEFVLGGFSETFLLGQSISRSLILSILSACVSLYLFLLAAGRVDDASLMIGE